MTSTPKISFVVPAYNEELLLARTLESIVAEIGRVNCAAEIIVVDDGSTDSTIAIAEAIGAIALRQEKRCGLVRARQAGFVASHGDLIANIDADTVLPEGWLQKVLREFERNPSLACLSGPYIYNDMSASARLAVFGFYCGAYALYLLNRFVLRVGSLVQGGNFVVTRQALVQVGGYSDRFMFYGEDTDIACRLSASGAVKFKFELWAFSSGRRLLSEGILRTGIRYTLNFIWATWFRRPFTTEWKDFR